MRWTGWVCAAAFLAGCEVYTERGLRESLHLEADEALQSFHFMAGSARLQAASLRNLADFMGRQPAGEAYLIATLPQSDQRLLDARAATLRQALGLASHELGFETGNSGASGAGDSGLLRVVRPRRVVAICEVGPPVSACANAANLAAMMEDPADLVFGGYRARYHARNVQAAPAAAVQP